MNTIGAAVVEIPGQSPRYRSVPVPQASIGGEVVDVIAVEVHPVTRGVAAGLHYASAERLPMIPGVDGVVRRADGSLAFVIAGDTGTLAERIVINPAKAVPLPTNADPAIVAATMNPVMSSWVVLRALRCRPIRAGPRCHRQRRIDGREGRAPSRRRTGYRRRPQ